MMAENTGLAEVDLAQFQQQGYCIKPGVFTESRWSVDVRYQSSDVPNNVGEGPEDVTADRDPSTKACYPPDADFFILDSANRENEITSYEDLARIRGRFMKKRPKFDPRHSSINGRGWTTCPAGVENVPPNDVRSQL